MHPNRILLERFYTRFQKLDSAGMVQCYHAHITFSDPVFPILKGPKAGAMWTMLCSQAKGFALTFDGIQADDATGRAHWEARYLFTPTGRSVHNRINAAFQFQDGKIIRHRDHFNFWKWGLMALGPVGLFLGWSPLLKNKVRRQAAKNLDRFIENADAT